MLKKSLFIKSVPYYRQNIILFEKYGTDYPINRIIFANMILFLPFALLLTDLCCFL